MSVWRRIVVVMLAVTAVMLVARSSEALPRYALRDGVQCTACHIDPAGGGMRNRYGRYVFAPTRLPLFNSSSIPPLNVDIGDTLAFGADSRSMYYYAQPGSGGAKTSTFFQMESNLYAAATLYRAGADGGSAITLYYVQEGWMDFQASAIWQQELGRPDISIYLKAGRFIPTYGLRIENHQTYNRQDIGFGPTDKDEGVELGAHLGPVLLQGSAINGTTGMTQFDDNTDKGVIGRAEVLGRLGKLRLMLGGSVYYSETGSLTTVGTISTDARTKNLRAGGHWGASMGRLTYMGELDVVDVDPFPKNTQTSKSLSYQAYQELDFLVVRGLELNLNYEFRDPDLSLRTGTISRVAAGFEVIPVPYVEIKTLFRYSFGSGSAVAPLDGLTEAIAMVHLFF
jgi:hypothetical protein